MSPNVLANCNNDRNTHNIHAHTCFACGQTAQVRETIITRKGRLGRSALFCLQHSTDCCQTTVGEQEPIANAQGWGYPLLGMMLMAMSVGVMVWLGALLGRFAVQR